MTQETLIKQTCEVWAEEARVPAGLADRALATRRRRHRSAGVGLAAGSTAVVAAAALALTFAAGPSTSRPEVTTGPLALSADTSVRTDLGNAFPQHLVAAGHTAVAAYFTLQTHSAGGKTTLERTWYLYDPASGSYQRTSWAYLDVAPGLHRAAVLAGPLPARRVGVLDTSTGKIVRWIPVSHKVGGVSWSPDGRRLVATAYKTNPDVSTGPKSSTRTGYYVIDTATGHSTYHALAPRGENPNARQDLGWSRDGSLLWAPTASMPPTKVFYDQSGHPQTTPAHEADTNTPDEAGLSPNGTLLPQFGPAPGPAVTVTNVTTGKNVAVLPIEQALAWADDDDLFALGCAAKACTGKGEFTNRLLLIGLGGKVTPLTGYQRSDQSGAWVPVFTHR